MIVRTGFTEAFEALSKDEKDGYKDKEGRGSCGLSPDEQVLKWHWEKGIAAVMTDTWVLPLSLLPSSDLLTRLKSKLDQSSGLTLSVAYEVTPFAGKPSIHETFLAGWGMPIGELLDLRELSRKCKELDQYTFMFVSTPLYVPGGIASPANASAIL